MSGARSLACAAVGVVAWLGLVACGSTTPVDEASGSSEDTGPALTDDSTEGPGMTGPASTGPGTTVATSESTADGTSTGDPFACGGAPQGTACQPPGPATIGWQLRIDGRELISGDANGACTVVGVSDDGVTSTVALDCTRFTAELDVITMNPHHVPDFVADDPVELRVTAFNEDEAVVARYLTLRRAGLALGAFDGSNFSPPPGFDFQPVTLQVVDTDCPEQSTECAYKQDAALQVDFDGQSELVFQGQEAFVGQLTSYRVITGLVEHELCQPDDCGFSYAEWFVQGLLFRVPEG